MTRHLLLSLLVLLPGLASIAVAAPVVRVVSPNGQVKFDLFTPETQLGYTVTAANHPVIETSRLGMEVDGVGLITGVTVGPVATYEVNESYPWRGNHAVALDRCHGARIPLTHNQSHTPYFLEVRAYDDGVAYRFTVPGGAKARVPDESSNFVLPVGSTVWHHNLRGHYEGNHTRNDVSEIAAGEWVAPPLTFKLPDGHGYGSITEANLVAYPGMALQADGHRGFSVGLGHKHPISYPFELRYKDDIPRVSQPASIEGTITTPWRVVLVGRDLNTLVNSDIVPDLNPPPDKTLFPDGMATAWVKPGRAVWNYLDGGAKTLEGAHEFSKLAGQLGFEYNVIEGYWEKWSDADIKELVAYSRQQGVGIWVWKHSKDLRDPAARHQLLQRCHDDGIAGLKIDFFDHEAKDLIDLYQTLLRETAAQHLLVNFHGSNKPTGESRSWPNELTREAVHGMEGRNQRALHNVTLPFTRFLAGPADYTPVHFGARRNDTTWAHQIASAAIFTSPLLTYAANPAHILSNPGVDMMKSIPSTWDETVVLPPSEIGEVAVFARRSGTTWFLAIMNGTTARKVNVPLSFLGEGDYHTLLIRDHQTDPGAVIVENAGHHRGDTLALDFSAGGGFIARFTR